MLHEIQQPRQQGGADPRADAGQHNGQPETESAWLREGGWNPIPDRRSRIIVAGRVHLAGYPEDLARIVHRQAALRPEGAKTLGAVKDLLKKHPTYPLQLTGLTEGLGPQDDLVAHSLARANAVCWAMVGQGVDPKRINVDGKGSPSPGADGSPTAHATENARVELSILYHGTE